MAVAEGASVMSANIGDPIIAGRSDEQITSLTSLTSLLGLFVPPPTTEAAAPQAWLASATWSHPHLCPLRPRSHHAPVLTRTRDEVFENVQIAKKNLPDRFFFRPAIFFLNRKSEILNRKFKHVKHVSQIGNRKSHVASRQGRNLPAASLVWSDGLLGILYEGNRGDPARESRRR